MEKKELLYEGKAKKVYTTEDPDVLIVDYKDDATAFNGLKKGTIQGKGVINNRMSNHVFQLLEKEGIPKIHRRKMELTEYFLGKLSKIPEVRIVGRKTCESRVAVVSLDFQRKDNAVAAFELEQEAGIMTRVGLHCAPIAHQSLGTFPRGTVRFAFSAANREEEIDRCIETINKIL